MKHNLEKIAFKKGSKFSFIELIIISITLSLVFSVITGFVMYKIHHDNTFLDQELVDIISTYNQIKEEYYGEIDTQEISKIAIDAMMNKLNEEYSVHLNSEETNSLFDRLNGSYKGIGIRVTKSENKIIIDTVYDNTPAKEAGLTSGDEIIKVNNLVINEETELENIGEEIRKHDKSTLEVIRNGEKIKISVNIKEIENPVIDSKIIDYSENKIGYIYLSSFSSNSYKQFKDNLKKLEKENIDSLIIDVRSNTGGYLTSATDILNMFLKKGKILYAIENKNSKNIVYDTTNEKRTYDIVVLTNQITASASEILAATLKESYGAIIIGGKTYGKGKVQETKSLSDKSLIKYTTANWYTPLGDSIDTIGIIPDIEVHLGEEYLKNPSDDTDDQLKKALEVLSK